MNTDIIIQSSATALYLKLIIDIWRYYNKSQNIEVNGYFWAILTVLVGFCISVILELALGTVMTTQLVANSILVGIMASAQAIGVTELQKRG